MSAPSQAPKMVEMEVGSVDRFRIIASAVMPSRFMTREQVRKLGLPTAEPVPAERSDPSEFGKRKAQWKSEINTRFRR